MMIFAKIPREFSNLVYNSISRNFHYSLFRHLFFNQFLLKKIKRELNYLKKKLLTNVLEILNFFQFLE